MENRERDKMSNDMGSDSGNVNRDTSSRLDKDKNESAGFKNKGQSENLNEPNSRSSSGTDSGDRGSTSSGR